MAKVRCTQRKRKEKTMSMTFPNETPDYRSARAALLEHEVALRRQMEAVATELRALPPGGEVPEDYSFDCIGADGAPSTVRLSQLFRGGDTLMLYHYMFPRHSQDHRPGPTAGAMAQVPLAEGRALHALRSSTCGRERCPISRPRSNASRHSRATRVSSHGSRPSVFLA
jgi:predicted dithiol-disulfide oxidoreductase (DUF899 family)